MGAMKFTDRIKTAVAILRSGHTTDSAILSNIGFTFPNGRVVDEDTALSLSAAWRCVEILSTSIAGMPRGIFRKKNGSIEAVPNHPANDLLRKKANSWMTSLSWNEWSMVGVLLNGNSFSIIERDSASKPIALIPIEKAEPFLSEGKLFYKVKIDNKDQVIKAEDMFHIRGLSTNGIWGRSVIKTHRENLGLSLSAQQYGLEFYTRGATPDGYIKMPGTLTPEARKTLADSWIGTVGLGKSRIGVLDAEMEFKQLSIAPEDAQYLGTRKFQKNEIATIFGVPSHMVNEMDRATFNNIEHQGIELVTYTLMAWMRRFETEVNDKLLTEREKDDHFSKWNANGLMRGDSVARAAFYASGIQNGWLKVDEARAKEDMNSVDGGDKNFVQLNLQDINDVGNEKTGD